VQEPEETPAEPDPREALRERLEAEAARLAAEGRERTVAAKKIAGLAKPKTLDDPSKLEKEAAKLARALPEDRAEALGIPPVLEAVRGYVRGVEARVRSRLGRELRDACAAAGVGFVVLSREDPVEVRLPPLLLRLDFGRGRAELLFAREVVAVSAPDAERILSAREKALRSLESGFDPERFFSDCLSAYRAALAVAGRPEGERVEILDFLPFLALLGQSRAFRANPAKATFRPYGKARFAYDVLRLRRAGALSRHGLRMNFGVATGNSASRKDRVVYLEDENGDGEYKLTVFFTPAGDR
jgi:hypothetical protein